MNAAARFAFAFGSIATLVLLAACSGNHPAQENRDAALAGQFMTAPTFSRVYSQTLSSACIECHQPGSAASSDYGVELDFSSQGAAFSSLQGTVASATSRGQCGGVRIVAPGSPKTSYLVAEIAQINLSQGQVNDIVGWIQSGAPNN
jgi:hypothetical protein